MPKYYHTKPPERMAQFLNTGTTVPPGHPCRFSLRQRGMAADNDNSNDAQQSADDKPAGVPAKPQYRTIVKRICIPRSTTRSYGSPWCRPTKRRTKKVVFYIDSKGNEYAASQVAFDEEGNLKVKEQTEEKEENSEEEEEEEEEDGEREANEEPDADVVVHHPAKYKTVVRRVVVSRRSKAGISPFCKPTKRRYRNVVFYVDGDGCEYSADSVIIDEHGNLKPKEEQEEKETTSEAEEQKTDHMDAKDGVEDAVENETGNARTPAGLRTSTRTSPRACRSGTSPASADRDKGPVSPLAHSQSSGVEHSRSLSPRPSRSRQSSHSEAEGKRDSSKSKEPDNVEKSEGVEACEAQGQSNNKSPRDQRVRKVSLLPCSKVFQICASMQCTRFTKFAVPMGFAAKRQ